MVERPFRCIREDSTHMDLANPVIRSDYRYGFKQ
jgi:hypothetical protein